MEYQGVCVCVRVCVCVCVRACLTLFEFLLVVPLGDFPLAPGGALGLDSEHFKSTKHNWNLFAAHMREQHNKQTGFSYTLPSQLSTLFW